MVPIIRRLPLLLVAFALAAGATYVAARPMLHTGPDPSKTGAPEAGGVMAEFTCNECHYVVGQDNLNQPWGHVRILDLPATYVAGHTYTLRVELDCDSTRADATRHWGFQITAYTSSDGQGAGTWIVRSNTPGADTLQIVTGFASDPWASRSYVEHRESGIQEGADGPVQWSFQWQAPATPSGTVIFAAAGNATNGNYESDGDWVFTTVDSVIDLTTPTRSLTWGGLKARYK